MRIHIGSLNPSRATSEQEVRIVQSALGKVCRWAEQRGLPVPDPIPELTVEMPISLDRVAQGYITEEAASDTLGRVIFGAFFPATPARAPAQQEVGNWCGLCYARVPWGQRCSACGGDRQRAEQLRRQQAQLQAPPPPPPPPPIQLEVASIYRWQYSGGTWEGIVVQDNPESFLVWGSGRWALQNKTDVVPGSVAQVWRPPLIAPGTLIQVNTIPPAQGVHDIPHQVLAGPVEMSTHNVLQIQGGPRIHVQFIDWYTLQYLPARPRARPQQPLLDAQVEMGKDFFYRQDRIFKDYTADVGPIAPEGWKLHVSADAEQAGELAEICLPLLREMKVHHKIVGTVDDYVNVMTGGQTGKLITIYAHTSDMAERVVARIDPAIAAAGIRGPVVAEEQPIGSSGTIFARYGGFTKSTVTDPRTRSEVEDVRGQIAPPWIRNPWA